MSRIPTSAMPRANAPQEDGAEGNEGSGDRASRIADKARDNPKTALAAGAVIAGAIAAAAIPLVRKAANRQKQGGKKDAKSKKKD